MTPTLRTGLACAFALAAPVACAQPFAYTYEAVATGVKIPVRIAFPPDGSGRLFYLELFEGNVQVIGGDSTQNGGWLHLNVAQVGERGLLGIAFDPAFTVNRFVYLYYTTAGSSPANRVERYTEVDGRADTASRLLLYERPVVTPCGTTTIHNGGSLAFGRDGMLYIGTGENGCSALSPSTTDPRGKVLRIDPRLPAPGNAVSTNPFYDDGNPATGNDDRIFAKGFRNPFGMRLNPLDSMLYVTENGPDCNDEVNRVGAGGDYGWRPACDPAVPGHCSCPQDSPYVKPLWRITPTIAPTGLTACTGNRYPELLGKILFVDNNIGLIWAGTLSEAGDSLIVDTAAVPPGYGSLYDIVQGPDGYLYISNFDAVRRVVPLPVAAGNGEPSLPRVITVAEYPNPFNPATNFRIEMPAAAEVDLRIADALGRTVAVIYRGFLSVGTHEMSWDAGGLASGVYYYRLTSGRLSTGGKLVHLQ